MTIKVPSNNPRGRPCIYDSRTVYRSFSLDPAVVRDLDGYCTEHGLSRSRAANHLLRDALDDWFVESASERRVSAACEAVLAPLDYDPVADMTATDND